MPCFNVAVTLDAALQSLVAQTFHPFEIIAVDDGSSDETPAIMQEWERREPRIRTLHTAHHGIVAALNRAAGLARGELLARMDADDICLPERLEKQVALLDAHPELAGCGARIRYFPRRCFSPGARRYEGWVNGLVSPEEIERDLFVECPIPHPTLLLRRAVFESIGGYREQPWPEDYDLVLRLSAAGHRLGKTAEVLLQWRESATRLSRIDARYRRDAFLSCKAAFLPRLICGRPVVIWGIGSVGRALGRALRRRGESVHAFVGVDPACLGRSIQRRVVLTPERCPTGGYFHVAAVGSSGARTEIRTALQARGLTEMEDYCAAA